MQHAGNSRTIKVFFYVNNAGFALFVSLFSLISLMVKYPYLCSRNVHMNGNNQ